MKRIIPPFTQETAREKVQVAEDAWNSKDPDRVVQGYTVDSEWRNRTEFFKGRHEIKEFLKRKWEKELDYALKKELWSFSANRISVRFEYEWRDAHTGKWYKTYGNEHWEFDKEGLVSRRDMSANDISIPRISKEIERYGDEFMAKSACEQILTNFECEKPTHA